MQIKALAPTLLRYFSNLNTMLLFSFLNQAKHLVIASKKQHTHTHTKHYIIMLRLI